MMMMRMGDLEMHEFEVDGRRIRTELASVAAVNVAALAGLVPPDDYLLVRIDGGAARRLAADEAVPVEGDVPRFRSGRVASPWTLLVDGERWDWAAPGILASEIREIAGIPAERPLRIDGHPGPVRDGGLVDLTAGEPRVSSSGIAPVQLSPAPALAPRSVPVVINGRPRELAAPDATFEDLVRLAFPQLPAEAGRTFTVTYRRGGIDRPEGSLVPHQAARLAPGAVINVSATNRS